MTTDIDTAMKHIYNGIGYGVMYIAHGLAINAAKSIAEEWSRLAAEGMRDYTKWYEEKKYNTDKPLLQNTYTLLRGLTFNIKVTADSALIYITIDDDVEPRNMASIQSIFHWQTYGVDKNYINIPARPIFYSVIGDLQSAKVMKKKLLKTDKASAQYNFDNGYVRGKDYKYTDPATILRHAKKSLPEKHFEAKISNYVTGELRWLE